MTNKITSNFKELERNDFTGDIYPSNKAAAQLEDTYPPRTEPFSKEAVDEAVGIVRENAALTRPTGEVELQKIDAMAMAEFAYRADNPNGNHSEPPSMVYEMAGKAWKLWHLREFIEAAIATAEAKGRREAVKEVRHLVWTAKSYFNPIGDERNKGRHDAYDELLTKLDTAFPLEEV